MSRTGKMHRPLILMIAVFSSFAMNQSEAKNKDKGVGPITKVELGSKIDDKMTKSGTTIFASKCASCHKFGERYVGPDLKGVMTRRSPEWILNMILNPAEMLEKNETAQELLGEYMVPMPFQNVTKEEARSILEYIRSVEAK